MMMVRVIKDVLITIMGDNDNNGNNNINIIIIK